MVQQGGIGHNNVKNPPNVTHDGTRAHVKHNNLSGHSASKHAKNRFNQKAKKQLIRHKHHSGGKSHLNHVTRLHRSLKTFHRSTSKPAPQSDSKIKKGIGLTTLNQKGGSRKTLRKKNKNKKTHKKPKHGKKSMRRRKKH